jgi:Fe-Mn family superoxide dismutase
MAHTLPPLPYSFTSLDPHMDAQTVELHWSKHHQTYITKLNEALPGFADRAGLDLLSLQKVVAGTSPAVINNAGGHYNHCLYWQNMAPIGSANSAPFGELAAKIEANFGSFDEFKKNFSAAAVNRFASGWAFLTVKSDGNLAVHNTPGHDNPLMAGIGDVQGVPILTCDVWEHAYYLRYQNRRAEFVENWWRLVNWDAVVNNYETYGKTGLGVPF